VPDDLSMRDVVKKVLLAEGESKRILAAAEAEAERLVAEARSAAQEIAATMRRESVEETEAIVTSAERDATRDKKEQLDQAATDIEAVVHLDEQAIRTATEAILRCVCGNQ
jgi:vacuolar-type H+-ATPase subunit H